MAGTQQLAGLGHLVEAVDTGGGFLGDALPVLHDSSCKMTGLLGVDLLEQVLDDLLLVAAGRGVDPVGAVLPVRSPCG